MVLKKGSGGGVPRDLELRLVIDIRHHDSDQEVVTASHFTRTVISCLCRNTTHDSTTLAKKKNHPRDSRREERCSMCDIMLDQARSAQGKSRGQSRIGLALR